MRELAWMFLLVYLMVGLSWATIATCIHCELYGGSWRLAACWLANAALWPVVLYRARRRRRVR